MATCMFQLSNSIFLKVLDFVESSDEEYPPNRSRSMPEKDRILSEVETNIINSYDANSFVLVHYLIAYLLTDASAFRRFLSVEFTLQW